MKNTYGLDVRALSLMRIFIAFVLLFDLCVRAGSLTAFYTKDGAIPFAGVEKLYWQDGYFSLFSFCDEFWYAALLFVIAGLAYLCLLLGFRTRLFSVLAWVMLVSLQNRNTLILQGGDDELRLVVFWGMFLPWGNFYSLDSKKYFFAGRNEKYLSVSSFGYLMLVFSVYFFSGVLKNSNEWKLNEGTAVYYAFNLDQMAWPLAKSFLSYPTLLKYLSVTVRWVEILLPFLLFIPFRNSLFRMIFVVVIVAFHLGISLTVYVGLFYLISISSLAGLLSPKFMDRFENKFRLGRTQAENLQVPLLQPIRENYYYKVLVSCALFFFVALSVIWNFATVANSGLGVAPNFNSVGYAVRLNQNWGMFAPTVLKEDGWYILEGFSSGKTIDINRDGKPADYTKPKNFMEYIKDDRWRKFGENYMLEINAFIRPYYCNYLLKDWNINHPERKLDSLNVVYMKEFSKPPGEPQPVVKEILCGCKN
ncbi:MAG: HTTM domain-containing protein [Bacteroidia bacterium]